MRGLTDAEMGITPSPSGGLTDEQMGIKSSPKTQGLFGTSVGENSPILQKARMPSQMVHGISTAMMDATEPTSQSVTLNALARTPQTLASIGSELFSNQITPESVITQVGLGGLGKALESPSVDRFAQDKAAQALGYTKRFLNGPGKIAKAREVGQTMLNEGVISPFANAEEMSGRVKDLAQSSGSEIGKYLKGMGTGFDPDKAIQEIESLRPQFMGGDYKVIHKALDRAIDTIKAHGGGPLSFEETNALKGILQEAGKFNTSSEALNIGTRRLAAGKFRGSMDSQLENIASDPNVLQTSPVSATDNTPAAQSGGVFQGQTPTQSLDEYNNFLKNKKVYGASQEAEKALNNRLSSEMGNKTLSLTDIIAAAPELATGNPIGAGLLVGLKRGAERYGNQILAVGANNLPTINPNIPNVIGPGLSQYLKRKNQ